MSEQSTASVNEYANVPPPDTSLTGRALGIDVGGTGIKAAVVDVASGQLVTERIRELTPGPATPEAVLAVVVDVVHRLEITGMLTEGMPGGVGFPSVANHYSPDRNEGRNRNVIPTKFRCPRGRVVGSAN